ncbi:MAG: hypothetical protein IT302_02300 [Dehalococcoidia bacterium]|nr:hypothetical protein [Dehalococcoidia bacterium]
MGIRTWLSPRRRRRDLLHAYVDGALAGAPLARFEAELARDAALAREAAQLVAIRRAAARLPVMEPPRSFRLTPAMVAAPAKAEPVAMRTPVALRLAQGVAAFSVLALAMTFAAQSLGGGSKNEEDAASAETANLSAAQDASAKSAGGAVPAPAFATSDASRSSATAPPTMAPFNPTLPPYSPTSGVTGQGVTATATAAAVTSPTPRAPATGPGDAGTPFAWTPIATPVAPVTGGESVATPRTTAGAAYSADGGVTGGAVAPAANADNEDGGGMLRPLQAALGVAALLSIGAATVMMLRRRRMT